MPNTLTDVMPKILASALGTLREQAIIPLLVNGSYSADAAKKGQVIDVPVPTKMAVQDVQPGAFSQSVPDTQIDTVKIPLNNWKESAFFLTDKDILEVMNGVPNMQIQEASRALGNEIAKSVYGLYPLIYNTTGTAGTTPFATNTVDATNVRKMLNKGLANNGNRRVILDVDAEANALNLPAFQAADAAGTDVTIREGQIGRKFGIDWFYDQLIPTHISGKPTAASGAGLQVNYVSAAPYTITTIPDANPTVRNNPRQIFTVQIDNVNATAQTFKRGDIFRVAGDAQSYTVTADATSAAGVVNVQFYPKPAVTWADNAVVTVTADHTVNFAFQRDAIALAIRSLDNEQFEQDLGNGNVMTMTDPVTRIPLRLEVRREWKRVRWSLDILWGAQIIRPEHCVRLLG